MNNAQQREHKAKYERKLLYLLALTNKIIILKLRLLICAQGHDERNQQFLVSVYSSKDKMSIDPYYCL